MSEEEDLQLYRRFCFNHIILSIYLEELEYHLNRCFYSCRIQLMLNYAIFLAFSLLNFLIIKVTEDLYFNLLLIDFEFDLMEVGHC